ncbi:MAG: nucleotidyltransferase family protein [Chlamydiae bacterium]|nr:nucleotidyltransferase family protein [Chlamydiota bacterium]
MDRSKLSCAILVGGLGTRLRSVLPNQPKVMALVQGRPFLEHLLDRLRLSEIQEVVLCVGHQSEVIENYFGNGRNHGIKILYSREKELLGTAGALRQASELIHSDPILAMNGDSFCCANFSELISSHCKHKAAATLVVTAVDDASRYGSVKISEKDKITAFLEKKEGMGKGDISAGIYLLSRHFLESIPRGIPSSIERDIFPSWIGKGLYAFRAKGSFIDIGIPSDLERAQELRLEGCH